MRNRAEQPAPVLTCDKNHSRKSAEAVCSRHVRGLITCVGESFTSSVELSGEVGVLNPFPSRRHQGQEAMRGVPRRYATAECVLRACTSNRCGKQNVYRDIWNRLKVPGRV